MIVVESKRLFLRQFHLEDASAMEKVFQDAEVMRFGPGAQTRKWVREWLLGRQARYHQQRGFGLWAVVEKTDREVIGYCGLSCYPDIAGQPETEVGYRLARAFWGCGYATEAAAAVRDYGFDVLCLSRLVSLIDPLNVGSIRVAEKIGMRYEKDVMLPGYEHPDRLYAIEGRRRTRAL